MEMDERVEAEKGGEPALNTLKPPPRIGFTPEGAQLEPFLQSREHEIQYLDSVLQDYGSRVTKAAWQKVPRHLRRRVMAHRPKRAPPYVRRRLMLEAMDKGLKHHMKPTKKKVSEGKKKRYAGEKRARAREWEERERRNGKWMETHVWHAKRMQMERWWGCKIAVAPCQKEVRSVWRGNKTAVVVHDASYCSVLEVGYGRLREVVMEVRGHHEHGGHGGAGGGGGGGAGAPGGRVDVTCAQHVWIPSAGWIQAIPTGTETDTYWLIVHPGSLQHVIHALGGTQHCTVLDHIICFDLFGPKALHLITGTLHPTPSPCPASSSPHHHDQHQQHLLHLLHLLRTYPSSQSLLKPSKLIAFDVHDPRLSFPTTPRNLPECNEGMDKEVLRDVVEGCERDLARGAGIFCRERAGVMRVKDGDMEARRAERICRTSNLRPTPQDATIPLLLISRPSPTHNTTHNLLTGLRILLPRPWGMDFWQTFIYAGAKALSYRDYHRAHTESGWPCFPHDFPFTEAYDVFSVGRAKDLVGRLEKRPKGKRPVIYTELEVGEWKYRDGDGHEAEGETCGTLGERNKSMSLVPPHSRAYTDMLDRVVACDATVPETLWMHVFVSCPGRCKPNYGCPLYRCEEPVEPGGIVRAARQVQQRAFSSTANINTSTTPGTPTADTDTDHLPPPPPTTTTTTTTPALGYLTSADFSYNRGHYTGIAVINCARLIQHQCTSLKKGQVVTIRERLSNRLSLVVIEAVRS